MLHKFDGGLDGDGEEGEGGGGGAASTIFGLLALGAAVVTWRVLPESRPADT